MRRKGIGETVSACRLLDEKCQGMKLRGSTDTNGRVILKCQGMKLLGSTDTDGRVILKEILNKLVHYRFMC
jgi:hypothetical protein